jgi:hypothetical protein
MDDYLVSSEDTPGLGSGMTLQSGYYRTRTVKTPNIYKYLQTNTEYITGIVI